MSLPSSISITQQLTPQLQQGLKGQELARLSKQLAAGGPSPRDSQSNLCNITDATVSRLTIVSREAKKKQAVRDEQVSYLHVAPL